MDGLLDSIGDGITGLVAGAIGAIWAALDGIVLALSAALPPGALPVIVVGLVIVVLWRVLRH